MSTYLLSPFLEYAFMQRALIGSVVVCLGAVPIGLFMTLRRMSLTGESIAHAILPGAGIAYIVSGLSVIGMTIGGLLAGLIIAVSAGWVSRSTHIKQDTRPCANLVVQRLGAKAMVAHDQNINSCGVKPILLRWLSIPENKKTACQSNSKTLV